jgi:simple sugar transport system permease protein
LGDFFTMALVTATLRMTTPLLFAALGGVLSERSGVINIALEGMMLTGAFFSVAGTWWTGNPWLGMLIGVLSAGVAALIHAYWSITLRGNQIVAGTAVNLIAAGLTAFLIQRIWGQAGGTASVEKLPNLASGVNVLLPVAFLLVPVVHIFLFRTKPGLHLMASGEHPQAAESVGIPKIPRVTIPYVDDWRFLGPAIGHLNLMVWLSFLLVIVSYVVLFKTPIGLRIRACGEHPRAADTVGINVYSIRYGAVVLSGVLAALGGAYLSIGYVGTFNDNMTAGRGFIALAAMIFGAWKPFGTFYAALLFGFSTALAYRLDVYSGEAATLFQALPYVLTLIAVAGVVGRTVPPAADGKPYVRQ